MNWTSASSLLADLVEQPVFALDETGTIRLANHGAEELFGQPREQLVGQPLVELIPPDRRGHFAGMLAGALEGARRRAEITLHAHGGERRTVTIELSALSGRDGSGVLCLVVASRVDVYRPSWPGTWLEIRTAPVFGEVIAADGTGREDAIGQACHRLMFGYDTPCADCPVPRLRAGESSADVRAVSDQPPVLQRVFRNTPVTAQISYTAIEQPIVTKLIGSRLDALATRCALSDREREVLAELVTGRSLEDIAHVLRISTRTVRFHQANVLAKLRIESRLDLIRLLTE